MYCNVSDNQVTEIYTASLDELSKMFTTAYIDELVECGAEIEVGDYFDNGEFTKVEPEWLTAKRFRRWRDKELEDTDWTQTPDRLPAADMAKWAEYRQSLRNAPEWDGFPAVLTISPRPEPYE